MIKVKIKKKENFITGFTIKGHANYDEYGKDIVCAALSMLTFNTIDTFTDLIKIGDRLNINIKDNLIEVELKDNILNDEKINLIFDKYELGIKSLVNSYGEYIELNYTEV